VLPEGVNPFPHETPTTGKNLLPLWIVLGCLGLIAIVIGGAFCYKYNKQKSASQSKLYNYEAIQE
jgi:hypothetical protein